MITKLKRIVLTLATVLTLAVPALVPVAVHASTADDTIRGGLTCGATLDVDKTNCKVNDTTGTGGLQTLVTKIINVFSIIVGVVAVIMIIVGGLKYITSGGESSNISGAKNTIIYAVIGLIVVALAQFIVRFVLTNTNNIGNS